MKLILYYDFIDEPYREGTDIVEVTMYDFPFEVYTEDSYKSLEEIYKECRPAALELAAYKWMKEYADATF